MKNGWKRVKLGELANLAGRIGWRGLTAKEYTKSGPLFLSVHSLNYGDYVDFRDAFHISQQRFDESPEIVLQPNDILICKDGAGIGKLGIIGTLPAPTTINSSLLLIRSRESIEPKYLFRCLSSPYFQEIVNSKLNGATTPHLYQRDITEFPVVLPPLPEQQRIVAILDEAFAAIATAKANAEKNLQNARAVFDAQLAWVYSQTASDWPGVDFSAVAKIDSVLIDPRIEQHQDAVHVGGANIVSRTGELIELKTAREEQLISGKFCFDEEMVLYSKIRPYLMKVARPGFSGLCSADIYPISGDPTKLERNYLYYLLLSPGFTQFAIAGSARSGMPKVNRDHLFSFRFILPPLQTQKQFADMLNSLDTETQCLESLYRRKLAALDELKNSFLHRAFNGDL